MASYRLFLSRLSCAAQGHVAPYGMSLPHRGQVDLSIDTPFRHNKAALCIVSRAAFCCLRHSVEACRVLTACPYIDGCRFFPLTICLSRILWLPQLNRKTAAGVLTALGLQTGRYRPCTLSGLPIGARIGNRTRIVYISGIPLCH